MRHSWAMIDHTGVLNFDACKQTNEQRPLLHYVCHLNIMLFLPEERNSEPMLPTGWSSSSRHSTAARSILKEHGSMDSCMEEDPFNGHFVLQTLLFATFSIEDR